MLCGTHALWRGSVLPHPASPCCVSSQLYIGHSVFLGDRLGKETPGPTLDPNKLSTWIQKHGVLFAGPKIKPKKKTKKKTTKKGEVAEEVGRPR